MQKLLVMNGLAQEFRRLAGEMLEGAPIITGPSPPNLISKQLSFLPGVFADLAPIGECFSHTVLLQGNWQRHQVLPFYKQL